MDQENPGPPQIKLEKKELSFSQEGQQLVVKQETDTSLLTCIYEGSDHSEDQTLCAARNESVVSMPAISSVVGAPNSDLLLLSYKLHTAKSQDQREDKHEDNRPTREAETNLNEKQQKLRSYADGENQLTMLERTIINHKELIDSECRLLDIALEPEIRLHRIEQHVCKEEKAVDDHQLCIQERNFSMDQDNPGPPQIKLEKEELSFGQEGQQLVVKQEMDTSLSTCIYERSDHLEDQTLCAARNESVVNMPVISSVVGAINSDLLLLSYKPHIAQSQDQKDDRHEDYGSAREAETNIRKRLHKGRSYTDDEHKPTVLERTIVSHKEEVDPQCRLLDIALKPEIRLHRIELPLQHVCKVEEEVLTDQQLVYKERNSSMDQEEPEPPRIKEEQVELCTSMEVELLVVKQETDTIMLTPTFEENEGSEDQTLYLNLDETLHAARKESAVSMPIINSVVGVQNGDLQLLSNNSDVVESQDQEGDTGEKDFNFRPNLHFKTSTGESPYICKTCGNGFRSKWKLTHHMTIHTGERPYICATCGKGFRSKWKLTHHVTIHTGEKPYVCQTCGKGFRSKSKLTYHVRIHTGEKPCVCKTCGKSFRSTNILTHHMIIHTGEKPYVCEKCGKGFRFKCKLTDHMRIHSDEKPFVCKTCGKGFRSTSTLTHHMIIHTGDKSYVCEKCGKCFRFKCRLTSHMGIHTGEESCVCKTCGQYFKSESTLTDHMTIHTGERPYICETCGKGFRSKSTLTHHMIIHTGEKPYVCEQCGKGFRFKCRLTSHMGIHTGEESYVCNTCGKGFRRSSDLTVHMRIHDGEKPFVCKTWERFQTEWHIERPHKNPHS